MNGVPTAIEQTFSIIKPDATERNLTGAVNALIEAAGLRIVAEARASPANRPRPSMACTAPVRSSANWLIS